LRDEVMTLFLAGHETTANALAWTIYLLTQHPDIARRLAAEVRPVGMRSRLREPASAMEMDKGPSSVGQACASAPDDLESDSGIKDDDLLSRVIRESLRLYPPVWAIGRRATQGLRIGGTEVPKGAIVLACQWALHRSDEYFSNPIQFDPDRWMSDDQRALPKYAFFPFGGGPRSCIGEGFAWMELRIVLTEILRRWRFEIVPGQTVKPKASITLRPERPIQVIVR
jgi:cytochrome P450